jgi:aspartyl-tRNA(Asn)/glutamyl-tRNA(Gln) amidotransferase subunit A
MIDLKDLTIEKAHESLKNGEYTVTDLVNSYLEVIKEKNKDINAYLEVYSDVLDQAKIAEDMFKNGTATLMTGIPIALKDNILFDGHIASASSKILENYKATYDADIIKQLKSVGTVFLGRVNMDEFAMGSSTETSAYGNTKNPVNPLYVPGGGGGG